MNSRKKGNEWQYRVRDFLRKNAYFAVISSNSVIPDIIAIKHGQVFFIECKANKKICLSRAEKQAYKEHQKVYGVLLMKAFPKHGVYSKKPGNVILQVF